MQGRARQTSDRQTNNNDDVVWLNASYCAGVLWGCCCCCCVAPPSIRPTVSLSLSLSVCLVSRLTSYICNSGPGTARSAAGDRRPTTPLDCDCDCDYDCEPHQSPSVRIKCLWLLVFVQNLNLMSDLRQMAAISRHVQRKALYDRSNWYLLALEGNNVVAAKLEGICSRRRRRMFMRSCSIDLHVLIILWELPQTLSRL